MSQKLSMTDPAFNRPAPDPNDWLVFESANFRVHFPKNAAAIPGLSGAAAKVAEHFLQLTLRTFYGADVLPLKPPYDIWIYPCRADFERGTLSKTNGHLMIEQTCEGSSCRIELILCSDFMEVVAHEVTHLANFSQVGLGFPVWLDEAMAFLVQHSMREECFELARQAGRSGSSFPILELLSLNRYPEKKRRKVFVGQAAIILDLLRRDEHKIIPFARSSMGEGPEVALNRHFGLTIADLETQWKHECEL
jgi:hypothetical protein